mgnify:CR=1 FL=1
MFDENVDFFLAWVIAIFTWFFGGLDEVVKALIALAVIDYITGVCASGFEGKLSSKTGLKGIARKIVMFSFVGIAHILDRVIGGSDGFREVICLFYIGNEGISIMENAYRLGVPFPKALRKYFEQLKTEHEEKSTKKRGTA